MVLIRIVGVIVAVIIGAGILSFLFTGDRRYLRFSWVVTRFALGFVALVLVLMFLERIVEL